LGPPNSEGRNHGMSRKNQCPLAGKNHGVQILGICRMYLLFAIEGKLKKQFVISG
jgi:hypothetical protein